MPESVLFENILPGRKFSDGEWLMLVHERAHLIRFAMDRVRLNKLGEFGYAPSELGGGSTVSIIGMSNERTGAGKNSHILNVEGIFRSVCRRREDDRLGRRHYVLGYTSAGSWLIADILEDTFDGRRYIRALDVGYTSPEAVVGRFCIEYRDLLAFLAAEYTGWIEKKREIFERMQRAQAKFAIDDRFIDALCAEPKKS